MSAVGVLATEGWGARAGGDGRDARGGRCGRGGCGAAAEEAWWRGLVGSLEEGIKRESIPVDAVRSVVMVLKVLVREWVNSDSDDELKYPCLIDGDVVRS